jgi:hypothetical protein
MRQKNRTSGAKNRTSGAKIPAKEQKLKTSYISVHGKKMKHTMAWINELKEWGLVRWDVGDVIYMHIFFLWQKWIAPQISMKS